MNEFILSCESTVDLTKEHLDRRQISYVCYSYELGTQLYKDDLGETISLKEFYAAMASGVDTKTTQINFYEFLEYFEPFLIQGKDVLHLCLSSGITGVMNSAQTAKLQLEEKYPERKIYLVDSLAASSGYGLLMDKLADLRDEGMSITQLYEWVERNKLQVNHWFFSSDLTYYIKGGRISKTAGVVGGVLGICPLLNVSADGHLVPRAKIRSKHKAIAAIVEKMLALANGGSDYCQPCYLSHSDCPELAEETANMLNQAFPNIPGGVQIYDIGTIIGAHTGPGTIALFFWGQERQD